MKLSARRMTFSLAEPFVISRGARNEADLVEVEIRHGSVSGFGEAAPNRRYHESPDSVLAWLNQVELGDDPFALHEIAGRLPPGQQAARAAVDGALHDLQGKLTGLPVHRLLGLRRAGPATSWTLSLGTPDAMARDAQRAAARGFKRLKLKLGARDGLDVERVHAVRSVTDLPLQVDVNEAWTLDEALEYLPQMVIQYCEQPLASDDPGGRDLKRRSPVPIYLDEDCHTLGDVAPCAERGHGINIKLAKSGGIREALRMIHAARALGLEVMLGCMVESGLGIAAALQIASLVDHVDLDSNLLLAEDPWSGVTFDQGMQHAASAPGLGVVRAY